MYSANVMIGAARNSSGTLIAYFDGKLDELRIWNYARSQAEIAADMNSQIDSAVGLIHHWGMNEGSGGTIADSVGTDDGTLNGAAWQTVDLVDLVAGPVAGGVDDVVLRRNDGVPAYNLAVVVDDALQDPPRHRCAQDRARPGRRIARVRARGRAAARWRSSRADRRRSRR
mgnify:CR=1 FL=1